MHQVLRLLTKHTLVAVVAITALSSCQTSSRTGQGEIKLSYSTVTGLKRYMDEFAPRVFAVSPNGKHFTYYYCPVTGCRSGVSSYHKAIESCSKKSGQTCMFLATSRNIVWQKENGTPYSLDELYGMSERPFSFHATLSASDLCSEALAKGQAA